MQFSAVFAVMLMAAVIILQYYVHLFPDAFIFIVVIVAAAVFLVHLFLKYRRPKN